MESLGLRIILNTEGHITKSEFFGCKIVYIIEKLYCYSICSWDSTSYPLPIVWTNAFGPDTKAQP